MLRASNPEVAPERVDGLIAHFGAQSLYAAIAFIRNANAMGHNIPMGEDALPEVVVVKRSERAAAPPRPATGPIPRTR